MKIQDTQTKTTGLSEEQLLGQEIKARYLDDDRETKSHLMIKIMEAKARGNNIVETTKELIDYMQPHGLGEAGYFWMDGVRVYEKGTVEHYQEIEGRDRDHILFGKEAPNWMGRK